jgi:hypothetical protein
MGLELADPARDHKLAWVGDLQGRPSVVVQFTAS